jgi:hypothetical protein
MEEFREFTTSRWPLEVAAASDTASASKSVYVQSQIQKLSPRPLKRFLCKATTVLSKPSADSFAVGRRQKQAARVNLALVPDVVPSSFKG